MSVIINLRLRERVLQDGEAIAVMYRSLGRPAAEKMVAHALRELSDAVRFTAARINDRDLQDLNCHLSLIERMAENLGMVSLGLVAADARNCLKRNDSTAFSAVWARLLRAAEGSLSDHRDLSGLSG